MKYALRLMYGNNARVVSQIAKVFAELGEEAELRAAIERSIREHSATSEMLIWLCKERDGAWRKLITPDLLTAILAAVNAINTEKVAPIGCAILCSKIES